ncbi:nuclear transport factor 2 family protein [Pseudomonas sp. BIGb0427]|uniref:nuclear transport factor 2 family protein n=1 Tax=unclassified Pseudomonas TaxID=196821 RepID=UPI0018A7A458|nr:MULTISPECIES: nuclear transport factor 2 family protein [unclassified Pseudomonas]QPG61854.1 nuclear transport factor 2 family protein [Pseudomonas sp. BIGb0427]UVM69368.1 nuclear transport factor 2 family protein [Pseudomonas sp. B21-009]
MALTLDDLVEIEHIKQLKYRYFLAVDCHDWAALEGCLAEDLTTALDGGKYSFDSRAAFIDGLKAILDRPTFLCKHHGHHPQIEMLSADTARGSWYLEDHAIDLEGDWMLHGTALYQDDYVKRDGRWLIVATGYQRLFETVTSPIPAQFKVTASLFDQP